MFGRQRPDLFRRYGVCPATPLPYLPAPFRLLARLRPEALRPTLSGGLPFQAIDGDKEQYVLKCLAIAVPANIMLINIITFCNLDKKIGRKKKRDLV
jgi:hypothetical protein